MLRCPNISLALLYVSLPNNIRRMLLYANFNFLIAVKALLYHIVEKHTLEHKDLNISQLKKTNCKMVTYSIMLYICTRILDLRGILFLT